MRTLTHSLLVGLLAAGACLADPGFELVVRWYRSETRKGGVLARIRDPGTLDVEAMKAAAKEAFGAVYGAETVPETRCWKVVELLADRTYRAEVYRVAALSPAPKGYLDMVLDDDLMDALVRPSTATAQRGEQRFRMVRFGESGAWETPRLAETLLHELAHVGQDFPKARIDYGADPRHMVDELMTWRSAFHEGWANYQAAHLPEAQREEGELGARIRAETEDFPVQVDAADGRSQWTIPTKALRAQHVLGTELGVARALWKLEQVAGREAMEAAFRATNGDGDRTLATFVGALVRAEGLAGGMSPAAGAARTMALGQALHAAARGLAGPGFVEALLAGRHPEGIGPHELPLELQAPAGHQAAAPPAGGGGSGSGGLLGQGD